MIDFFIKINLINLDLGCNNPKKEQFEQVSTKSETIEVLESAISATTPSNSIELARPTTTEKTAENETMQLLKKPLFWDLDF